jgi:hypothetical protein
LCVRHRGNGADECKPSRFNGANHEYRSVIRSDEQHYGSEDDDTDSISDDTHDVHRISRRFHDVDP